MDVDASSRRLVVVGCLCAGFGVAAGAFGAHMLKEILEPPMLAVYDTATRYQMYHAIALVLVALLLSQAQFSQPSLMAAGWAFIIGITIFSGSLYALSLTDIKVLGAVAPIGGAAFIAGWGCLAYAAFSSK